jgi:hypothetical protein
MSAERGAQARRKGDAPASARPKFPVHLRRLLPFCQPAITPAEAQAPSVPLDTRGAMCDGPAMNSPKWVLTPCFSRARSQNLPLRIERHLGPPSERLMWV